MIQHDSGSCLNSNIKLLDAIGFYLAKLNLGKTYHLAGQVTRKTNLEFF